MEALQYQSHAILRRETFEIEVGHQPQNALMILKAGRFSCTFSQGMPFVAEAGDLICFPAARKFERHVLEPCVFHLIYFALSENNPFSDCLPAGKIRLEDHRRMETDTGIFDEMPFDSDEFVKAWKEHAINDLFLMFCREQAPMKDPLNRASPQVRAALRCCTERLGERLTLQILADAAGVSAATLNRHFRKELGVSPMEYLTRLRMRTAANILCGTAASVGEIAEQCGYDSIYYFSNAFKKRYGCSPAAYRKRMPRA